MVYCLFEPSWNIRPVDKQTRVDIGLISSDLSETLKPRDSSTTKTDARSISAANHSIDAEVELFVGLHARIATRVEAVARHVLSV